MKRNHLQRLVASSPIETYAEGQVFYALDFKEELYVVKSGYVKRYSVTELNTKVIESIYGPDYFFPLSTVYKKVLDFELSQENNTYIYQALTNVEIQGISSEQLAAALEKDALLYQDLLYEAGKRLKANINRLASNAIKDEHKKTIHQIVYLAEEFGKSERQDIKTTVKMPMPLTALDFAEQLNISFDQAKSTFAKLKDQGLIEVSGDIVRVPDIALLKDAYLR